MPSNLKSFGTYNYANTKKRLFQRLRINNNQFCFDKNDISVFFWKSFRVLFKLPKFKLVLDDCVGVYEIVLSNSRLRLLNYRVRTSESGWEVKSTKNLEYKVYVDNRPTIKNSEG